MFNDIDLNSDGRIDRTEWNKAFQVLNTFSSLIFLLSHSRLIVACEMCPISFKISDGTSGKATCAECSSIWCHHGQACMEHRVGSSSWRLPQKACVNPKCSVHRLKSGPETEIESATSFTVSNSYEPVG